MPFLPTLPETQVALAISIFVGTFVYEDGAALLAATLSASGRLDPALGLAAAFMGIWIGDMGLYAMGSTFWRYTTRSRRLQRFLKPESLAKAQAWFAKHGSLALVMSRAIPGSRLPLYLAAGALRLPFRQFVRITGVCAALWVSAIFAIWRFTPKEAGFGKLLPWMLTAIMLLVPWLLARRVGPRMTRVRNTETTGSQGALSACAL